MPEGRKKYTKSAPLQFEEFADGLAWWNNREENTQVWRIDFAAKYADAKVKAEPLWKQAEQERQAATELGKKVREIDLQLNSLADPAQKLALQDEQKDLKAHQRQHEEATKAAQREGDSIYWPIYNLDLKNPHGKESLEHVAPQTLVAAMLENERDVMRLLAEIESLVGAMTP